MFVFNRDIPAKTAGDGVTRKVLAHSAGVMVCELTLEAGSAVPLHAHPHEQITYILSGTCRYTVGGETKQVGVGDSVLIPPQVPHSIAVLADMVVVDVFSPGRADFL